MPPISARGSGKSNRWRRRQGLHMPTCKKTIQAVAMAAAGTATPETAKTANRHFWQFRNIADSQSAELMLYGDIAQYSWYKDDVTAKQFADELAALGPVNEITVRINSGGGDVFAAQSIGNLLEQRSEEHTSELQSRFDLVCRLLLEKK